MTDELIAFLKARLDEDEAVARAAGETFVIVKPPPWNKYVEKMGPLHDLREVTADRRLLAELEKGTAAAVAAPDNPAARAAVEALLWVASIRAAVWSDHPDYRGEWRP